MWIVPCNIEYYDVDNAFSEFNELDWKQSMTNISVGDYVLIYLSSPVKKIKYLCKVKETNKKSVTINDEKFYIKPDTYVNYGKYMQLQLVKNLDAFNITFDKLKANGLKGSIQGPINVTGDLFTYFDSTIRISRRKEDINIICCEIAWMEKYAGPEDNVSSGGEWVKKNGFGHEEINFLPDGDYYKGFVQSSNRKIKLERINPFINDNAEYLDDVLVVWCAKRPNGKRTIVGYYKKARVYRTIQSRDSNKYEGYYFVAKTSDSKLLAVNDRNFDFDSQRKGNFGEANIWYGDALESRKQIDRIKEYVQSLEDISNIVEDDSESLEVIEGKQGEIFVSRRERNPEARRKCIEYYGYTCQVCGVKLEDIYGPVAENYIHVHHLQFISDTDGEHTINPIKDLITVCPNCHAMLHSTRLNGRYLRVDELKNEIAKATKPKYDIGVRIKHPINGIGTILQVHDDVFEIDFSAKGMKKIKKQFVFDKCKIV